MHLVIEEVTFVDTCSIFPGEFAAARPSIIPPRALVLASISILHAAITVAAIVVEFTSVYTTTGPLEDAMAVSLVSTPLSFVPASVIVFVHFNLFGLLLHVAANTTL